MERLSFDSAIEELTGLDGWLTSLGVDVKKDRWHDAELMLRRAKEQRRELDRGAPFQPIPNYVAGLFELLEVLKVFRAFSDDSSPILREKVSRALCGPISPMEESPRNNEARNAMFELVLAANWKNGGAIVELGEPDIRIVLGGTSFLVECKRPFSSKGVRRNIEDAAGQLRKALSEPPQASSYGLVAVSLSRIFNPGNVMFRGGWATSITRVCPERLSEITGGAPLLALFEKWPDELPAPKAHCDAPKPALCLFITFFSYRYHRLAP